MEIVILDVNYFFLQSLKIFKRNIAEIIMLVNYPFSMQ